MSPLPYYIHSLQSQFHTTIFKIPGMRTASSISNWWRKLHHNRWLRVFSTLSVIGVFFPNRKIFVPSDLHPEPEFSARKYCDLMQRVGKKAGIQFLEKPWALNAYQMSKPTVREHKSLHRWEIWSQINPKLSHKANNQNTAIWMDYCSRVYVDFLLVSARPWPTTLYCTEYKFLPRNPLFLVKPSNLI